jgi:hypothetical protein
LPITLVTSLICNNGLIVAARLAEKTGIDCLELRGEAFGCKSSPRHEKPSRASRTLKLSQQHSRTAQTGLRVKVVVGIEVVKCYVIDSYLRPSRMG